MPAFLTTQSKIRCPHGGLLVLSTANALAHSGDAPILLLSDVHLVVGCPFVVGVKPQPCMRVQWTSGTALCTALGTPFLTQASTGICFSADGIPQGMPIVEQTQLLAQAL